MYILKNYKDIINLNIDGLIPYMNDLERNIFDKSISTIKKLEDIFYNRTDKNYYINLLPLHIVKHFLEKKIFLNCSKRKVKIIEIEVSSYNSVKNPYYIKKALFLDNNQEFSLSLSTFIKDFTPFNLTCTKTKGIYKRFFTMVTSDNASLFISDLLKPFKSLFNRCSKEKYNILKKEGIFNNSNLKGEREIIKRNRNSKLIEDEYNKTKISLLHEFNNYLTDREKEELITWLNKHILTLRLYLTKGGIYDNLISRNFPDSKYGKKIRTIPNNSSKGSSDQCNGYLAVDSLDNCPIELFRRISNKKDSKDVFKKYSNQYRFNNYSFVLYLLYNFNSIGYITGIRNLNKKIINCK